MAELGWDKEISPYHEGEQALHDRLGIKDRMEGIGRQILRPYMPRQHSDFFAQLPFVIAGSVDGDGWPWASMLVGKPGFIASPDEKTLTFASGKITGDPFFENASPGQPVGFVGIELPTRRRNRLNGVVGAEGQVMTVEVVQSFGNCPQYINTRDLSETRDPGSDVTPAKDSFDELPEDAIALIAKSDTLFVASHNTKDDIHDVGGVDASHRGGKPGFVKIDGNTLTIPDYLGNFAFNTFGNFLINPKAGLLFIDFETGDMLQLTGTVDLLWDGTEETEAFRGAERAWQFHVDHGHTLRAASPYRWALNELSPNAELTGDWDSAAQIMQSQQARNAWRRFRVAKVEDESSVIRSFYFEPEDGEALLPFSPGQFLTLRVTPEGEDKPQVRTYTVSSAPCDPHYQISVKREGLVSQHMHKAVQVGDIIDIRAPKGAFWMDTAEDRPAVLLAGGVGITPMVSMARQAAVDGFARRRFRPVTLIHAARNTAERAFHKPLSELQEASNGNFRYVSVISAAGPDDTDGIDYDIEGRITREVLQQLLAMDDYDFYLCGPAPFMQGMYDALISLGVQDARIMAEAFGPAALTRHAAPAPVMASAEDPAEDAIVTFNASQVEQAWTPEQGTLLEFAEAHGLTPAFSCRSGTCGSCATKVLGGKVAYTSPITFEPRPGEALICSCVPAKSDDPLILDL